MSGLRNSDSNKPNAAEHFNRRAKNYERFTGGSTRDVARHFLTLVPRFTSSSVVLDNGCGPGVTTDEIIAHTLDKSSDSELPRQIHAVDKLESMVVLAKERASRNGWTNVSMAAMDAEELTFDDATFTHSFTNFVIFFVPDAIKAATHIYRTLQPGGTAVVTAWSDLAFIPVLRDAQLAVRPDLKPFSPPIPEEWFEAATLERVLRTAGFNDVRIVQRETGMRAPDFETLASLLRESYAAATEHWSEEEKPQWVPQLKKALAESPSLRRGENGEASVRMVANIAVATK